MGHVYIDAVRIWVVSRKNTRRTFLSNEDTCVLMHLGGLASTKYSSVEYSKTYRIIFETLLLVYFQLQQSKVAFKFAELHHISVLNYIFLKLFIFFFL